MNLHPVAWLCNSVRNRIQATLLGKLVGSRRPAPSKVRIVAATPLDQKAFWRSAPLGRSLGNWKGDHRLVLDIAFGHGAGLPAVYNAAIDKAGPGEALLCVQDSLQLRDGRWLDKLLVALDRYDVVGLAGDAVDRVDGPRAAAAASPRMPTAYRQLDGSFLAFRADLARRWRVRFDDRFPLALHDVDFCRTARAAGWSLGAWPIEAQQEPPGLPAADWDEAVRHYAAKWRR